MGFLKKVAKAVDKAETAIANKLFAETEGEKLAREAADELEKEAKKNKGEGT